MTNSKNQKNGNNLFVYGTLRSGESRNYVLQDLEFKKAELPSYKKIRPPGLGFPFIIEVEENSDISVAGEVYFDLKPEHWEIVDKIEGEGSLYHRIKVQVITTDEEEVDCYTYYPSEELIKQYTQ